jgi:6-phosphogluconolactonase (cycloisomerase 2 family)
MKATGFFSSTVTILFSSILLLAGCGGVSKVSNSAPPSPPTGGSSAHGTFVYVSNASGAGNSISGFRVNPDGTLTAVPNSPFPTSGNFAVLGSFLLVANQESVTSYAIDPSSGSLTRAQTVAAAGNTGVTADAIAADSKNVYVGGELASGTSVVYAFSIDNKGSFAAISGSPFLFNDCACRPVRSIAVQNSMLFASSTGFPAMSGGPLAVYNIQDGVLAHMQAIDTDGVWDLAMQPSGRVVYAVGSPQGVEGFVLGPSGALSQSPVTQSKQFSASAVAIDPTGKFLAAIEGAFPVSSITVYSIDPVTAGLAPLSAPVLTGKPDGNSIVFDPSGKFVVVTHGAPNDVTVFSFDPASGTVTKIQSAPTDGFPVAS